MCMHACTRRSTCEKTHVHLGADNSGCVALEVRRGLEQGQADWRGSCVKAHPFLRGPADPQAGAEPPPAALCSSLQTLPLS